MVYLDKIVVKYILLLVLPGTTTVKTLSHGLFYVLYTVTATIDAHPQIRPMGA